MVFAWILLLCCYLYRKCGNVRYWQVCLQDLFSNWYVVTMFLWVLFLFRYMSSSDVNLRGDLLCVVCGACVCVAMDAQRFECLLLASISLVGVDISVVWRYFCLCLLW